MFAVMAVTVWPLTWRMPRVVWDRRRVVLLVTNALFDALNLVTFFAAIAYTTVAIAVITHYVAPILIALAAPRIDGTHVRGARPAAVCALAGLAAMLEPWRGASVHALLGASLGLASAVCYAGNVFVAPARRADRRGACGVLSLRVGGHAAAAARGERPRHGELVRPRTAGIHVARHTRQAPPGLAQELAPP